MNSLSVAPTRFFKCVDCGFLGDFGFVRKRNLRCSECGYDLLTEYTADEYVAKMLQRGMKYDSTIFVETEGLNEKS